MDQSTTDVLLRMVDTVREILAAIEASGTEGDIVVDGVIQQIHAVLQDPAIQTAADVEKPVAADLNIPVAAEMETPLATAVDVPAADTGPVADDPGSRTLSDSSIRVDVA
jgi:two-component system chemotaxis sensor kinase CheA